MNVRLSNVILRPPGGRQKHTTGGVRSYTEGTGASNKQLSDETHAATATGYYACRRQQLGQEKKKV